MNNVNAAEMQKFVAALAQDASLGKKNKKVTGTWSLKDGTPQFSVPLEFPKGKATINVELPPFAGGWGTSPDPIQVCLSGLAACFAVTYAAVATAEGIRLTKLQVTAENWMDLRKQMGLSKDNIIDRVKFTVDAAGADRATLQRLMRLAEERCPGSECVTRAIPLETVLA
ncbi:MAG: OsmC family protein [Thermoplasmatota archaeon]